MSVAIIHSHPNSTIGPAAGQDKLAFSFLYGDERIVYERTERSSDVQRVLIKVHPDCRVKVQAPATASDDDVLAAVKKRARWIARQLDKFRTLSAHVRPRQYVSGESHYYLGRQYVLKVLVAPDDKPYIKLLRGKLEVSVRQKNPEKVRALLNDWYKARAKEVFAKRLDALLEQALWVSGRPPLRIQSMQTQWGSCSPNGRVTLSPHLVKAPRVCIDYVILHELCHTVEHNHSERFYRLLKQVMPKWEQTKVRLDGIAAFLLNDTVDSHC